MVFILTFQFDKDSALYAENLHDPWVGKISDNKENPLYLLFLETYDRETGSELCSRMGGNNYSFSFSVIYKIRDYIYRPPM